MEKCLKNINFFLFFRCCITNQIIYNLKINTFMSFELYQEVKSSFILKMYNKISKLRKYITHFKWIAGILFIIGLLDTLANGDAHKLVIWLNVIVWIPGFIFVFTGALLHFLTGLKLRNMARKYGIEQSKLQIDVDDILNSLRK